MNEIARCFIDTETTGLNPKKNGIIQIGGVIERGLRVEEFNFKVRTFPEDEITPEALKATKTSLEEIKTYPTPQEVYSKLERTFMKFVNPRDPQEKMFFVAYNARFDFDFLIEWWKKLPNKFFFSWFWRPYIDVMTLAGFHLWQKVTTIKHVRLENIVRLYGGEVEVDAFHDALYDAKQVRFIYNKIREDYKVW